MHSIRNAGAAKLALSLVTLAVLSACGGGGGGGNAVMPPAPAAPQTLTGTVAVGAALANATLTVFDAAGEQVSATSDAQGHYSVPLAGLTAPLVITANDPAGLSVPLYSVVPSTDTGRSDPVIANVTPLTTAVAAQLTEDGNPGALVAPTVLAEVTPGAVSASVAKLNTALAPILAAQGLDAGKFDPIGDAFTPNQTGADAVIEAVSLTPSSSGTGLQLASLADPNAAIALNKNAPAPAALPVPPQPANYLAALVSQLGGCMAGTPSACATAIDAGYLNQGTTSFPTRHPGLMSAGSKLTGVKTLAFLDAGTLPNIRGKAALVYFLFTDASGAANFASDIVQQRGDGSWNIVGNQEDYNLYIAAFVGRKQFANPADAGNGRLESGLEIRIPATIGQVLGAEDSSGQIASARVEGPGLPADGLYLTSAFSGFGPYLTIPVLPVTAPVVSPSYGGGMLPNLGLATQFKWSWASLTGGESTFAPNGLSDYAAQPADVSNIPQFAVYTVTLFDMKGRLIGTPQKVLNVAPNAAAAAGTSVAWQTLDEATIANVLTPGGSATSAHGDVTTTLRWTVPEHAPVYPNPWAAINSLDAPRTGEWPYPSQPYSVMNTTAPVRAVDGSYTIVMTDFVDVLVDGGELQSAGPQQAVQVQLGWQAGGLFYTNVWQYGNY